MYSPSTEKPVISDKLYESTNPRFKEDNDEIIDDKYVDIKYLLTLIILPIKKILIK